METVDRITTDAILIRAHIHARVQEVGHAVCESAACKISIGLASLKVVAADLCAVITTDTTFSSADFTDIANTEFV